jgi:hypothetical protein
VNQIRRLIPPAPAGRSGHLPWPPGHVLGPVHLVPVHTATIGGIPRSQIGLIAAGAALLVAGAAAQIDRLRNRERLPRGQARGWRRAAGARQMTRRILRARDSGDGQRRGAITDSRP